jgi:hypothetical protein
MELVPAEYEAKVSIGLSPLTRIFCHPGLTVSTYMYNVWCRADQLAVEPSESLGNYKVTNVVITEKDVIGSDRSSRG